MATTTKRKAAYIARCKRAVKRGLPVSRLVPHGGPSKRPPLAAIVARVRARS